MLTDPEKREGREEKGGKEEGVMTLWKTHGSTTDRIQGTVGTHPPGTPRRTSGARVPTDDDEPKSTRPLSPVLGDGTRKGR